MDDITKKLYNALHCTYVHNNVILKKGVLGLLDRKMALEALKMANPDFVDIYRNDDVFHNGVDDGKN
jgi:hypothetical protein